VPTPSVDQLYTVLPVERTHKIECIINLKTVQSLGLTLPRTVLFQADEVLQ
jgi:hypothetical protein